MAPAEGFEGDEFSNNLFSDLAPLLTLFGEQVTKQFLTMSMGWADNLLLAMGPIGIITIIVSAIRVGGGKNLKALIGRARESRVIAEQELLSSTSEHVCELWNGREIVRLIGHSEGISNLLVDQDGNVSDIMSEDSPLLLSHSVHSRNWVRMLTSKVFVSTKDKSDLSDFGLRHLMESAPNIALNVKGATTSAQSLRLFAAVGILLQMAAVVFPGITTYRQQWTKAGVPVASYGYPCFLLGTICLTIGMLLAGHIIEGATTETMAWLDKNDRARSFKIITLQQKLSVGDQRFPCCIILPAMDNGLLRMSSRNSNNYRNLATLSASLAILGYIVQFVGLRALHWSATIVQLGITVIMTAIRAWVRRSLALNPNTSSEWPGHEDAWLALALVTEKERRRGGTRDTCTHESRCLPRVTRQDTIDLTLWQRNWNKWSGIGERLPKRLILSKAERSLYTNGSNFGFHGDSVFWELISNQSYNTTVYTAGHPVIQQLLKPVQGPLTVELLSIPLDKDRDTGHYGLGTVPAGKAVPSSPRTVPMTQQMAPIVLRDATQIRHIHF